MIHKIAINMDDVVSFGREAASPRYSRESYKPGNWLQPYTSYTTMPPELWEALARAESLGLYAEVTPYSPNVIVCRFTFRVPGYDDVEWNLTEKSVHVFLDSFEEALNRRFSLDTTTE